MDRQETNIQIYYGCENLKNIFLDLIRKQFIDKFEEKEERRVDTVEERKI